MKNLVPIPFQWHRLADQPIPNESFGCRLLIYNRYEIESLQFGTRVWIYDNQGTFEGTSDTKYLRPEHLDPSTLWMLITSPTK